MTIERLVADLREWCHYVPPNAQETLTKAADELERLTAENARLTRERDRLRSGMSILELERNGARAERDEARAQSQSNLFGVIEIARKELAEAHAEVKRLKAERNTPPKEGTVAKASERLAKRLANIRAGRPAHEDMP